MQLLSYGDFDEDDYCQRCVTRKGKSNQITKLQLTKQFEIKTIMTNKPKIKKMITGKVFFFNISLKGGAICSLISVLNIFRFGIKVTGNFIQVTSPHYAYLTYIVCCAFDPESNRIVLCTK